MTVWRAWKKLLSCATQAMHVDSPSGEKRDGRRTASSHVEPECSFHLPPGETGGRARGFYLQPEVNRANRRTAPAPPWPREWPSRVSGSGGRCATPCVISGLGGIAPPCGACTSCRQSCFSSALFFLPLRARSQPGLRKG